MDDERARREWIETHGRLVVRVARRYVGQGLSLADLAAAGAGGLRRAAERFDAAEHGPFAPYASWWIRQAIARAVAGRNRLLRIPRR